MFLSRDLDSRISSREVAAVEEWLRSDKDFHFMRDHPEHGVGILGSGWGVKLGNVEVRNRWKKVWSEAAEDDIFWADRFERGYDQMLLYK